MNYTLLGYSFSDDHINQALSERLQRANRPVNPRPVKLVIIDYAKSAEDKANFVRRINDALGGIERFVEDDPRVKFGGANSIAN